MTVSGVLQLVRDVGDEVAAHRLEAPRAGEVEEREHGAAVAQRARREHDACARRATISVRLRRLARERAGERVAQRAVARQEVGGEGDAVDDAEQPARRRVHAITTCRCASTASDAFLERLDERGQERVVGLERREARRELLRHAVHGVGEIADLARAESAGRRESRRPASAARRRAAPRPAARRSARRAAASTSATTSAAIRRTRGRRAGRATRWRRAACGRSRRARRPSRRGRRRTARSSPADGLCAMRRCRPRRASPRSPRAGRRDSRARGARRPRTRSRRARTPARSISVTRWPSAAPARAASASASTPASTRRRRGAPRGLLSTSSVGELARQPAASQCRRARDQHRDHAGGAERAAAGRASCAPRHPVAEAAHGLDQVAGGSELGAESLHVHVHRARLDVGRGVPDGLSSCVRACTRPRRSARVSSSLYSVGVRSSACSSTGTRCAARSITIGPIASVSPAPAAAAHAPQDRADAQHQLLRD